MGPGPPTEHPAVPKPRLGLTDAGPSPLQTPVQMAAVQTHRAERLQTGTHPPPGPPLEPKRPPRPRPRSPLETHGQTFTCFDLVRHANSNTSETQVIACLFISVAKDSSGLSSRALGTEDEWGAFRPLGGGRGGAPLGT